MNKHKSFRVTDCSLRDLPWAVGAYFVLSLFSIGLGLLLEPVPTFLSGLLMGTGGALLVAFFLLRPIKKEIDVATLPSPSAKVREVSDDPARSFADAVKVYREETGLGLAEAKAVLQSYQDGERNESSVKGVSLISE